MRPRPPGARMAIDVTIVAGSVQLSKDGKVIRVHPIRHDRSREFGAFASPQGRPRRKNSAIGNAPSRPCRLATGTHLSPRCRYLTFTVRRSPARVYLRKCYRAVRCTVPTVPPALRVTAFGCLWFGRSMNLLWCVFVGDAA
jgi:hypothetical protein